MAELPLSKFAPFTKEECRYQEEVSNHLKEIGVHCANCIYLGERAEPDETMYMPDHKGHKHYRCTILEKGQDIVCEHALCRFFTNKEEVEDPTESSEPDEELSIQIQKLDFTNSGISESINKLRERLTND